jgi:hypothetical protein
MIDSIRDTAHAARVAFLAAQKSHIRIVSRRVAAEQPKVSPVEPVVEVEPKTTWTDEGLSRLLVDVLA